MRAHGGTGTLVPKPAGCRAEFWGAQTHATTGTTTSSFPFWHAGDVCPPCTGSESIWLPRLAPANLPPTAHIHTRHAHRARIAFAMVLAIVTPCRPAWPQIDKITRGLRPHLPQAGSRALPVMFMFRMIRARWSASPSLPTDLINHHPGAVWEKIPSSTGAHGPGRERGGIVGCRGHKSQTRSRAGFPYPYFTYFNAGAVLWYRL
ncbi:hypothetical protein CALVIDRAFT_327109 [Calocera viscosa TUFC12733]|uniref:Uncharacterized protein n=1 Tax=Calocera viscosa (strain TUFC12733) TaxID=1330018 RepID=A0A167QVG9_CALVF|nr:hypothetical protein CALVIDRAFT_327109 [Calocera viscosa TUFC12733]